MLPEPKAKTCYSRSAKWRYGDTSVKTLCVMLVIVIASYLKPCAANASNLLNLVTDFGADPTGVIDSTTQLQAFFNQIPNGWQGYIPTGTYLVSSGLYVQNKTAIRIVGAAGGSFGSPVLSWAGPAGGTTITMQGTSYSSIEHVFILGQIGICVDTDTSPSSHDHFEDIQCRAPSIAGFRFGGITGQDSGHHVLIKDNVLCDTAGGDAFQFLDTKTVFNRIVAGSATQCGRSLLIQGGSLSTLDMTLEWPARANIEIQNANAPIVLHSSQLETDVSTLNIDGPANAPLPVLVKNWRVDMLAPPSFAVENQSLGPLTLENNGFESDDSFAASIIGTGSAFAPGSTLLGLGNEYTLNPLSSLNTPYGPGPQRIISMGEVGQKNDPIAGQIPIQLSTIIEGPQL